MSKSVPFEAASGLIADLMEAQSMHSDMVGRRQHLLDQLIGRTSADAGLWCWGRGHPLMGETTPITTIRHGFTDDEFCQLAYYGLTPEATRFYREPYFKPLETSPVVSFTRPMLWSDEEWYGSQLVTENLVKVDYCEWVVAVRFTDNDNWSCLSFHRRFHRPAFSTDDNQLLELALTSIPLLWAPAHGQFESAELALLTPRQRSILLGLLDGYSRKQMAAHYQLSLHTVNDHIKAIFKHFDVSSATELAALFLKSK